MKYKYLLLFTVFATIALQAQISNDSILIKFDQFLNIPESNIHLHLNKSVLMQGEDLGFAAYVFDHKKQKPSQLVKNVYVQLLNSKQEVVKEQMILAEQGKAHGTFELDSLITAGDYQIRSFTNWMKNFKKPLYFEAAIKVMSSEEKLPELKDALQELDLQIMPEGGALVENVLSTVGVSLRGLNGQLLDNAIVSLMEDQTVLNQIQIDERGLGRFALMPLEGKNYKLLIKSGDFSKEQSLPEVLKKGVVLSVREANNFIYVALETNEDTLDDIEGDEYYVTVNGNDKLKLYTKAINDLESVLTLDIKQLNAGVNQVSLFTNQNQLVSQRLFYNYEGFKIKETQDISITRRLDTLETVLSFDKKSYVSISVHPTSTIALDKSQSITSTFKLQPYLRGVVKNPLHYLKDINSTKKLDMDNLLLCYGWVMYDWEDIFTPKKKFEYAFEQGVSVKVDLNNQRFKSFVIYSGIKNNLVNVDLDKEDKDFVYESYYPMSNEKFEISGVNKKGDVKRTALTLEFSPNSIPYFNNPSKLRDFEYQQISYLKKEIDKQSFNFQPFVKNSQALDTVLLTADRMKERNEKLRLMSSGRIDFFDDEDRRDKFQMDFYLNSKGFNAITRDGKIYVSSLSRRFTDARGDKIPPVLILDGALYTQDSDEGSFGILSNFDMSVIDYVEIVDNHPRNVLGQAIIINTDPGLSPFKLNKDIISSYEIPLTFTTPKKFYRPAYYSYTDDFFNKLGVIDWQGDLEVVDGKASFTMPYLGKDELLFHIQGWTEDGELIDEYREVKVE